MGIGLDLVVAFLAPHDEAHTGPCGVAERHRGAVITFHAVLRALRSVALNVAPSLGGPKGLGQLWPNPFFQLAPRAGLEPATKRLTARGIRAFMQPDETR